MIFNQEDTFENVRHQISSTLLKHRCVELEIIVHNKFGK